MASWDRRADHTGCHTLQWFLWIYTAPRLAQHPSHPPHRRDPNLNSPKNRPPQKQKQERQSECDKFAPFSSLWMLRWRRRRPIGDNRICHGKPHSPQIPDDCLRRHGCRCFHRSFRAAQSDGFSSAPERRTEFWPTTGIRNRRTDRRRRCRESFNSGLVAFSPGH